LEQEVEAIKGIEAVLDALDAASIPYAVGSNGRIAKMEVTLGRTGLLTRFEGRLYSGQLHAKPKPAPDLYLYIADQFGVAPADAVVIEDSASGAGAAYAAKIPCYGYAAETPRDKLAPFCTDLFEEMDALPKLLGLAG
jgi:HAD superfamily hydrolase (TIGR01509 family)